MENKLIELLMTIPTPPNMISVGHRCGRRLFYAEIVANHLIAHGVVVATDNNDGCKGCLYENRKRPQKCSCCSRNIDMKDCYTPDFDRHWTELAPKGE